MTALASSTDGMVDLENEAVRGDLAKVVATLLDKWELPHKDQCNLLGLSATSRSMLCGFAEGKPLPKTRDVLDRVGYLLAIHRSLRLLYPKNESLRYSFVTTQNTDFDNLRPLDLMERGGLIGIAKVARYLERERGR